MPTTLPKSELELGQWLTNFATQCAGHQTELGLTNAQLAALGTAQGAAIDALATAEDSKNAYRAAIADKDVAIATAIKTVQPLIAKFQADPNLSPGLLAILGVVPRTPGGGTREVTLPTNLMADVNAVAGQVTLTWDPNGNAPRTRYKIEAAPTAAGPWSLVYVTERKRVVLTGYAAGETVYFRVFASRGGRNNGPTNLVAIYPESSGLAA